MVSYQVSTDAQVQMGDRFGEPINVSVKKGTVTPKSEQEEVALEHLVALGFAKRRKEA